MLVLDLKKMAPGVGASESWVPISTWNGICALLRFFVRFCAFLCVFARISQSGFKGPTWTYRSDGGLRHNSHLTNPNQFEHVAFKSKSQPSRCVKSKKHSKPPKTNDAKIKGTNRDLRYEPRIQVRTGGGAEIKGTMDGSGMCIDIILIWFDML